MRSWPEYASGVSKLSYSQFPAKVIAPLKGLGVPSTVTCRPPTSVDARRGVAYSTHASSGVTTASPLEVATIALVVAPVVPWPDCPPNATRIVTGALVVLVNVSSQRPQLALVLTYTERDTVAPPMSMDWVVRNRSTPSIVRPKPRMSSPLR